MSSPKRGRADATSPTQVLEPLGRFDEALAQLGVILAGDLGDAERTWMLFNEGLVLMSANRLEAAESRFSRVSDLGYVEDNPRMIAAAAWGHGMVAARREDVGGALKWFGTAENTALGTDDDLLGVPFHCEAATALGALGELEMAERHLASAQQREQLVPGQAGADQVHPRCASWCSRGRRCAVGDHASGRAVARAVGVRSGGSSLWCDRRCPTAARSTRSASSSRSGSATSRRSASARRSRSSEHSCATRLPRPLEPVALAASPRPATMAPDRVRTNQTRIRVIGGPIVVQTAAGNRRAAGGEPAAPGRRRRRPRWHGQLRSDQRVDLAR